MLNPENRQVNLLNTAELLEPSKHNETEIILNDERAANITLSLVTNTIITPTTSTTTMSFNAADAMAFSPMPGTDQESEVVLVQYCSFLSKDISVFVA